MFELELNDNPATGQVIAFIRRNQDLLPRGSWYHEPPAFCKLRNKQRQGEQPCYLSKGSNQRGLFLHCHNMWNLRQEGNLGKTIVFYLSIRFKWIILASVGPRLSNIVQQHQTQLHISTRDKRNLLKGNVNPCLLICSSTSGLQSALSTMNGGEQILSSNKNRSKTTWKKLTELKFGKKCSVKGQS